MKCKFTQVLLTAALVLSGTMLWAQSQTPLNIAVRHVEQNFKHWELTQEDVSDMVVTDNYRSKKSGVTHIYFNQRHAGIIAQNAIINVNILENGKVVYAGKTFVPNLAEKVNTTSAQLAVEDAMNIVLQDLELGVELPRPEQTGDNKYRYQGITTNTTFAELSYYPSAEGYQLVWHVMIYDAGQESWGYQIDASTGQVLAKKDLVIRCAFGNNPFHNHDAHCRHDHGVKHQHKAAPTVSEALMMGGTYRVFPFTVESPAHGDHELISDPADPTASPFGWHDTDGDDDPDYTHTRGNNVYAYLDRNSDGISDLGNLPDGGADLIFDFPYDGDLDADFNQDAAVTNLFFWNNTIHDFTYAYGFDEQAGNFQRNTYGNGGTGNDEVQARAQAGADVGSLNNANFATPPDGGSGTMNMFVWNQDSGSKLLTVDAPSSIGGLYDTGTADYGPAVSEVPVSGEVVEVNDNTYDPFITDGCEDFVNVSEVNGKIALVDRGGCFFEQKTANAEAAGAIAIIICNFEDEAMGMAGVPEIDDPTIPTVSIGAIDCQTIRQFVGNGLEVTIVLPQNTGPEFLDGDFDNGIIAHEYGHGISNRLTGGPSQAGCLGNGEQMGEGWSDFFALVTSVKPGDTGDMRRGVGTYVIRQDNDGRGIRRYPYSTDMSIAPLTYGDVAGNPAVHPLGEVWCNMIWDLYWAMVEEHGFDEDQWFGTGGNNMAIQLVMEGMKMQQCSPGFVSGRDAILAADEALYNGENQCLIWGVFARRGCGVDASEGSTASGTDQIEDFESLPTCIKELRIRKAVTPLINAGDNITVTMTINNYKDETVTNVTVTDELLDGTAYIEGSGSTAATVVGNTLVFDLGDMATLDEVTITYELTTDPSSFSVRSFYNDVESVDNTFWVSFPVEGTNFWGVSTVSSNSGETSWYVQDVATESQQILRAGFGANAIPVSGANPVLRFYHQFNTEGGADAGLVEVSTDGGIIWSQLGETMFRNPYNNSVQYATFTIPNLDGFSGDSDGWIASYLDMGDYVGQDVLLRFNFGTDDNTVIGGGWFIDDLEIMDMINYDAEVCITTDQGDNICTRAPARGTIVESQASTVSTNNLIDPAVDLSIFPNPADDQINVTISGEYDENVTVSLVTLEGKEVYSKVINVNQSVQTYPINTSNMPAGFYIVKASTDRGIALQKVVIK